MSKIIIDPQINPESTNPVQNKAVCEALSHVQGSEEALKAAKEAKIAAGEAKTAAGEAKDAAQKAITTIETVKKTAEDAKTIATDAKTTADSIKGTAEEAKTIATDAKSTAESIKGTAEEAKELANKADNKAIGALAEASTALGAAGAAGVGAFFANRKAGLAQITADAAAGSAGRAQTTADNAQHRADEAYNRAQEAYELADDAKKGADASLKKAGDNMTGPLHFSIKQGDAIIDILNDTFHNQSLRLTAGNGSALNNRGASLVLKNKMNDYGSFILEAHSGNQSKVLSGHVIDGLKWNGAKVLTDENALLLDGSNKMTGNIDFKADDQTGYTKLAGILDDAQTRGVFMLSGGGTNPNTFAGARLILGGNFSNMGGNAIIVVANKDYPNRTHRLSVSYEGGLQWDEKPLIEGQYLPIKGGTMEGVIKTNYPIMADVENSKVLALKGDDDPTTGMINIYTHDNAFNPGEVELVNGNDWKLQLSHDNKVYLIEKNGAKHPLMKTTGDSMTGHLIMLGDAAIGTNTHTLKLMATNRPDNIDTYARILLYNHDKPEQAKKGCVDIITGSGGAFRFSEDGSFSFFYDGQWRERVSFLRAGVPIAGKMEFTDGSGLKAAGREETASEIIFNSRAGAGGGDLIVKNAYGNEAIKIEGVQGSIAGQEVMHQYTDNMLIELRDPNNPLSPRKIFKITYNDGPMWDGKGITIGNFLRKDGDTMQGNLKMKRGTIITSDGEGGQILLKSNDDPYYQGGLIITDNRGTSAIEITGGDNHHITLVGPVTCNGPFTPNDDIIMKPNMCIRPPDTLPKPTSIKCLADGTLNLTGGNGALISLDGDENKIVMSAKKVLLYPNEVMTWKGVLEPPTRDEIVVVNSNGLCIHKSAAEYISENIDYNLLAEKVAAILAAKQA